MTCIYYSKSRIGRASLCGRRVGSAFWEERPCPLTSMTPGSSLRETLPCQGSLWLYLIDISVTFYGTAQVLYFLVVGVSYCFLEERNTYIRGHLLVPAADAEQNA